MSQSLVSSPTEVSEDELITELALGSARGAKRQPFDVTVVRGLTAKDVPMLLNPPAQGTTPPEVKEIKYSHHRLAMLMAQGKPSAEIQLITGYSLAYQSNIKRSPAFQELLDYYSDETKKVFVDAMERLKDFGVSTLDELKRRLEEKPELFTSTQLMEATRLGLLEPLATAAKLEQARGGQSNAVAVAVKVNFIGSGPTAEAGVGAIINGTSQEVEND